MKNKVNLLILEVVVNVELAAHGETRLVTVVVVAKVVAVAGRLRHVSKTSPIHLHGPSTDLEGETERVVGRRGAAISLPVQTRGLSTARGELRKSDLEEKLVRQSNGVLAGDDGWQRRHTGGEGDERRSELHLDGLMIS